MSPDSPCSTGGGVAKHEEKSPSRHSDKMLLPIENLPDAFPPIYIYGEEGQGYHPRFGMDKDTWTLIIKTHVSIVNKDPLYPFIMVLLAMFGISFFVLSGYSMIIAVRRGYWMMLVCWIAYGGLFRLYFICIFLRVKWSCRRVANEVNRILQAKEDSPSITTTSITTTSMSTTTTNIGSKYKEQQQPPMSNRHGYKYNEQMAGYTVYFKASPIPGRQGRDSWRYQLVRNTPGGIVVVAAPAAPAAPTSLKSDDEYDLELVSTMA